MFEAYIDESGIHTDAKVFTLAGFVAPKEAWHDFTPKWQAVLSKPEYKIGVFHAAELSNNKGEFKKWKDDQKTKTNFVLELLDIIDGCPDIVPFYTGTIIEDFDTLMRPAYDEEKIEPYYQCFKLALVQIGMMLEINNVNDNVKVPLFLDRQREFSSYAKYLFDRALKEKDWSYGYRFSTMNYDSKDNLIPLQVADAIAYESYRELDRRIYEASKEPRRAYARLMSRQKRFPDGIIYNEELINAVMKHSNLQAEKEAKRECE